MSFPRRRPYERIGLESALLTSAVNIMTRLIGTNRAEYVGRRMGIDPLRSWFYYALRLQNEFFPGNLTYFEFGVGWGGTLLKYVDALKSFCRETKSDFYAHHLFLFDSFEGLPPKADRRDDFPDWNQGVFGHKIEEIKNLLEHHGIETGKGNIHFIKGYYDQILTEKLRDSLSKPSIITVDVDYYSSAMTVLGWLRPILRDGILFYFDDVWSFHGDPNRGELAAINDFNRAGKGILVPYHAIGGPQIWDYIYAYVDGVSLEKTEK